MGRGVFEEHASECNCFWGYWASASLPARFFWKFFCVFGGAERNFFVASGRGLFWAFFILPWVLVVCAVLCFVGILSDIICCVGWSATFGWCCKECNVKEKCCEVTETGEPWKCLE